MARKINVKLIHMSPNPSEALEIWAFSFFGGVHLWGCSEVFKGVFTKMNTGVFRGVHNLRCSFWFSCCNIGKQFLHCFSHFVVICQNLFNTLLIKTMNYFISAGQI